MKNTEKKCIYIFDETRPIFDLKYLIQYNCQFKQK